VKKYCLNRKKYKVSIICR